MSDGRDFLPPDVKALVDAERHRFAIPDEAQDRLLSKLAAGAPALGHGGHGAGPSAPPAGAAPFASGASGASTLLGTTAAKLIVALSVVGAATVLVQARSASRAPAVPVAASSPSPPAVARVDAPLPAPPLAPEAPSPAALSSEVLPPHTVAPARELARSPSATLSAPPREETREDTASLAEERNLLDAARASIVGGSPEAAVPVLESCAVRFPGGPLTEERLALQIRALARTGRGDEARALLATMRTAYPHSFVLQGAIDDVARIP
jgi:hypothetical protein